MRIAVNARFLLKDRLEGLGRFSHEVLQRIVKNHPEHEFLFLFDRKFDSTFVYADNIKPVVVYPPARHPLLYPIWFDWSLPRQFKKWKADVFLSPDGFLSLRSNIPQIPVIHDLAFEHFPQFVSKRGARYYKKYFPKYANKAIRIATVSEFSKKDIVETYGISADKISVVYNGASTLFTPTPGEQLADFRQSHFQNNPWFVYVGSLHPRKNIARLLKAFDRFKSNDDKGYKLVIVGRMAWQTDDLREVYNGMKFSADVVFTGHISDEEMIPYLSGARSLVYVPVFEGFGLPILEAFQCGIPAITSNCSSLPEVAGDAAILVNPESVEAIANAMSSMACNNQLHNDLTSNALVRAKEFSWDKTAEALWKVIENAMLVK